MKIKTIFPDINKNEEILYKFFSEENFKMNFHLRKKIYYSFLRPILPIKLRKKLQKRYNSKIKYEKNFIKSELVNIVRSNPDNLDILKKLYNQNTCSIIITHDVDTQQGFDSIPKIIELEKSLGIKSAWFIVPYKYQIHQEVINIIKEAGHEIGIHGYNHDGHLYYSQKIFNERAVYINKAIKKYATNGFRSPSVHRDLEWLQALDIQYEASFFDYDPFQPFPGGTGSIWPYLAGKFVEIPYTLPQDHTLFYVLNQKDITIWKNKIDWLVENNGVILTLTHPDYLIDKQNFYMYKELLEYLNDIPNAYRCLPSELASKFREHLSI